MKKLFMRIFHWKRDRNIPTDPWPDAKLETKRLVLDKKLANLERLPARRTVVEKVEQPDDEMVLIQDEGRPDVRIGGIKAVKGATVKPRPCA